MAHSLSSNPFHGFQSSTSVEVQRHGFNNSYRQHHRNETTAKEKIAHGEKQNRFKMSSLKGKSWGSFAEAMGCESSEDETEDTEPEVALVGKRQHKQGSIVRLKKRDISLYGHCPQSDPFAVVVCRHCRMVLKPPSLKSHIEKRHEKERKHEPSETVIKVEKLPSSERSSLDKTNIVAEKFTTSVVIDKYEKIPIAQSFSVSDKNEKLERSVEPKQRHRHFQRKSATPSENSSDAAHFEAQNTTTQSPTESSSASNSPQPKRRKRKHVDDPIETFQSVTPAPATCRIIVEPSEIVIRDANSSPPPLAPITNEPHPSVWIVTAPSPTVIIDGSFVVKPLEQETESEFDLKDLKVLKPLVKESLAETPTFLTPSNWYPIQPRPLAVNTFNMRKLNPNAQRYVMATQRKLIELERNLKTEEKVGGKVPPKTWSFIERGVSLIPFRVTH